VRRPPWDASSAVAGRLTRRTFVRGTLTGAVAAAATGRLGDAEAATRGPQIAGSGRIHDPLPGVTIPSPSDFGFAVDANGGTFVCSMFGPGTGGFKGCDAMTVEGVVTPGSLQIHRGTATFSGKVSVLVAPDVFFGTGAPVVTAADQDFTVTVQLGGPGRATMVLHIPSATAVVGGDTGGVVAFGRIEKRRIRA
jgi:hypothetical protein